MDWLLFFINTDEKVEIIFTKSRDNSNVYKVFTLPGKEMLYDFESDVLNVINTHVSLRVNVYLICDIKSGDYVYVSSNMKRIVSRCSNILDLDSYNVFLNMYNI